MTTSKNKYHTSTFKDCQGVIFGKRNMKDTDIVHWCPTKHVWHFKKSDCILSENDKYKENKKLANKTIKDILVKHYLIVRKKILLKSSIFHDLQFDSLAKVQLCILIEKQLSIAIYDKEKDRCETFEDLVYLVERKIANKNNLQNA